MEDKPAIVRDLGALGQVRREIACGRSDEVAAEESRKEMSRFVKWASLLAKFFSLMTFLQTPPLYCHFFRPASFLLVVGDS